MAIGSSILGAAGAGSLGTLFIKLTADSTLLVKGMGQAEKTVMGSATKMAGAITGIATAVIATAAVLSTRLVKSAIDAADAMGKTAQKAGQLVESFSALAYSAGLADVSQQELAMSAKFLTQWMERTGKEAGDLTQEIIKQADIFASMEDGAAKLRLAYERFGRSGNQLIPLLNQGSAAIKAQMAEAEAFGQVISKEFSGNAQQFNDNLKRIQSAFKGVFNMVAERLLPVWIELQERFIQWIKDTDAVRIAADVIIAGFETMGQVIDGVRLSVLTLVTAFKTLATIISTSVTVQVEIVKNAFDSLIKLIGVWWGVVKNPTTIASGIEEANKIIQESTQRTAAIVTGVTKGAIEDIQEQWTEWSASAQRILEPIRIKARGVADAVDKATQDIVENSLQLKQALDAMGAPKNMLEGIGLNEQMARQLGLSQQLTSQLSGQFGARPSGLEETAAMDQLQMEKQMMEARLSVMQELANNEVKVTEEMNNRKLEAIKAYNDRLRQLQLAEAQIVLQTSSKIFTDLSSIAEAWAGKQSDAYKGLFAASKAFAIADAGVRMGQALAQVFADPSAVTIWQKLANVGVATAAMASIVSSIQSVQLAFGGERAEGGPVSSGRAFLVGEEGPEMFVPSQRGNIIPNDAMGGGATKVIVNNYTDVRPEVTERNDGQDRVIEIVLRRVKNEIASEIRDGRGDLNRSLEGTFGLRRGQR